MKKLQDRIGTVVFWAGLLSLVGIAGALLVIKGMVKESQEKSPKDQGAVRQPVRPTCTKRSCKFPWDVPKLSGEGSEQDSKPQN